MESDNAPDGREKKKDDLEIQRMLKCTSVLITGAECVGVTGSGSCNEKSAMSLPEWYETVVSIIADPSGLVTICFGHRSCVSLMVFVQRVSPEK